MQRYPARTIVRYLIAFVIIAAAFAFRRLLDPLIGTESPFSLLVAGVMVAALTAGGGPGIFATALATVAADYFYVEPVYAVFGNGWHDVRLAIFAVEGVVISWIGGRFREMLRQSAETERLLAESDRRKDEFLAMLSHELRNPLAPLSHALRLLRNPRATEDIKQQAQATMQRQVELMVRLVDDLLDISRIARGKLEFHHDTVALADVIGRAVEISQPLIDAKRHRLVVSVPEQPLWLDADPLRVTQVFCNLLNNAAKYTPDGGEVTISAEATSDRKIAVTVSDVGIGIPPDKLSQLFVLFTQIDGTQARSEGGLGLGLALARGIVERHGGSINAYSDGANCGSRFVVHLPAANPPQESQVEPDARARAAPSVQGVEEASVT